MAVSETIFRPTNSLTLEQLERKRSFETVAGMIARCTNVHKICYNTLSVVLLHRKRRKNYRRVIKKRNQESIKLGEGDRQGGKKEELTAVQSVLQQFGHNKPGTCDAYQEILS